MPLLARTVLAPFTNASLPGADVLQAPTGTVDLAVCHETFHAISRLSTEQFAHMVTLAPDTRPGRYTILEHLALNGRQIRTRVGECIDVVAHRDAQTATEPERASVTVGRRAA